MYRGCLAAFLTAVLLLSLIVTVPITYYVVGWIGRSLDDREYVHPGAFWITEFGKTVQVAMVISGLVTVAVTLMLVFIVIRYGLEED